MSRRLMMTLAVACVAVTLGSCSSSGGTQAQSDPPSNSNATATPTSAAPSSAAPSPSAASSWTPPAYGAAQPAVAAYLKANSKYNAGLRNPARFNPAPLEAATAGEARSVFINSIADEKKHGRAYRGTPDTARVIVTSSKLNGSLPSVVLSDCQASATTDPWTEFVVSSGKAVPAGSPPRVAPPYAATIKMFQPNRKAWVITSFTLDGSKTCTR